EPTQMLVGPDIERQQETDHRQDRQNYPGKGPPASLAQPRQRILRNRSSCTARNSDNTMTDAKYTSALPESTPRIKSTCCDDNDTCSSAADSRGKKLKAAG